MDKIIQDYAQQTPDGRAIRAELFHKFFRDLHATLQTEFFNGNDFNITEVDGIHCELQLPPPEELEDIISVEILDTHMDIDLCVPGVVLSTGEFRVFHQPLQYTPPPLEEKLNDYPPEN